MFWRAKAQMNGDLIVNEPTIRLGIFASVLVVMALWELAAPKRRIELPRLIRWSNNLALVVIDSVVLRLVFPLTAVAFASYVASNGWGLFNLVLLPDWLEFVAAVLLFDLVIYGQHMVFHHVPWLWRLHRMHHADTAIDVTTGLRFHPLEILLSMVLKFAAIAVLGPSAAAVLVFEVVLNASSLFNHSNIQLPPRLDKLLRFFVVTPDMHRVHHSVHAEETNSNYGFNLTWWDYLFGTLRQQPRDGHLAMTIGLKEFRDHRNVWLDRLLLLPFLNHKRSEK
jgi:sterol desaturase/sphingolipid hydroxylase (fatty acid hydroxylase superfamily)